MGLLRDSFLCLPLGVFIWVTSCWVSGRGRRIVRLTISRICCRNNHNKKVSKHIPWQNLLSDLFPNSLITFSARAFLFKLLADEYSAIEEILQMPLRGFFSACENVVRWRKGGQKTSQTWFLPQALATSYFLSGSGHLCFSPYPASAGKIRSPNALRGTLWGLENVSKI